METENCFGPTTIHNIAQTDTSIQLIVHGKNIRSPIKFVLKLIDHLQGSKGSCDNSFGD
jgi:hypothetical protein